MRERVHWPILNRSHFTHLNANLSTPIQNLHQLTHTSIPRPVNTANSETTYIHSRSADGRAASEASDSYQQRYRATVSSSRFDRCESSVAYELDRATATQRCVARRRHENALVRRTQITVSRVMLAV
ncbi:hypothetical protein QE152_g29403 [Popillia japonica]|uniref:Uncharacterized protein n=1 Tax=Popillia japonica TaxID=7064 RepID=A0AAW1JH73_POPJA